MLAHGDLPQLAIGRHQVLVEVYASSITPRDWLIRAGKYQLQFLVPAFPLVLCSYRVELRDGAGKVHVVCDKTVHVRRK